MNASVERLWSPAPPALRPVAKPAAAVGPCPQCLCVLSGGIAPVLTAGLCSRGSFWQLGFPGGASGKEPACQYRRLKRCKFDPLVRKISGGGHGSPRQYSCLEKPVDRGAWWAPVHGVTKICRHD